MSETRDKLRQLLQAAMSEVARYEIKDNAESYWSVSSAEQNRALDELTDELLRLLGKE